LANESRLPPGQYLVNRIPVLHEGEIPKIDIYSYIFKIFGSVEEEVKIDLEHLLKLPKVKITADWHCVTQWTKLDVTWEGIPAKEIFKLVKVKPEAKAVMTHAYGDYSSNLTLEDFLDDTVLFATKLNDKELTPQYGAPLRLVVPKLYAWKSVKWVKGIEFMEENKPGFWEERGYNMRGDPWKEERYSNDL